ncbi:protein PFC0760c-like isoform X2 [Argiope bruennichi]|uniref:protein PFC0760c-like isoform X2 n=1 Tax=Argiope bruennichi TaxID=94029 RepID=UPI002494B318|nr:protein PFC0760c-like isoform X2 [Argiope bruennichi]
MKNMEVAEISNLSESSGHKASDKMKLSPELSMDAAVTESAEQDSCIKVVNFATDDSSSIEIYKSSDNKTGIPEEILKFVSDTCDTVQIIVNDKSSMADIGKLPINEIVISEEISKLVSDICNKVEIVINGPAASNSNVDTTTTDSEGISKTFANDDLYDAEVGDDDDGLNNISPFDNNESFVNDVIKNSSELAECDTGDKISEMNEDDEECANSFLETDVRNPIRKERHWTERASLPYYREPKPDFFEYTRKLQEKLDPKPSAISSSSIPNSSSRIIVLDEPVDQGNKESDLIKPATTSGTFSTKFDLCLEKSKVLSSKKPVSGLIILDDYKSPRIKNSHFSRSSDMWNLSSLQSAKEQPEPAPGSKYKALKEQLMEKIMLKKEESLIKRKEEQEFDEENFEEEEEVVSDGTPYESANGSSDDDMEDDSPENTGDDVVLKDMLLKECENFPDREENLFREPEDSSHMKNSEAERVIDSGTTISEDSQEPMECYSLPSYQPGGGFTRSPLQNISMKRMFSDSDFNDSALNFSLQPRSKDRIFSDSDFTDSAPSESPGPSQLKNVSTLEFKNSADEQLPFEGSDEQEIIPHWDSLPASEKQGSQLFDEDISVICSGKFPSTNEEIPWTPSSSTKNSLPDKKSVVSPSYSNHTNNETDHLNESDDEELVRPAKKIKLSLIEKLWDSDDENDADFKHPIVNNGELKKNHRNIQSDSDDDADQDNEPVNSKEEDELDDQSENLEQVNESFEESHVKKADDKDSDKKFEINNFFENEAELSGEEGSSDENEDDIDEYMDDEMITDEIVASEEKLRKEVGTIHFKRQQDEDDQIIRQLKNDFLPEGELYNENGQRKRRFIWNNIGMDDNEFTETKSDSEEEEVESLPTDYLKWQQEKNKSNLPDDDNEEEIQTPKSIGLKVDIIGKVSVTRYSNGSNSSISASPALRRGSFLNSSIGKNMKFVKEFSSSEGSVSRKNFVFSSPQPNASLPSTPTLEVKSTRISNVINNRSIFNKI